MRKVPEVKAMAFFDHERKRWLAFIDTPDGECELKDATLGGLLERVDGWASARQVIATVTVTCGYKEAWAKSA